MWRIIRKRSCAHRKLIAHIFELALLLQPALGTDKTPITGPQFNYTSRDKSPDIYKLYSFGENKTKVIADGESRATDSRLMPRTAYRRIIKKRITTKIKLKTVNEIRVEKNGKRFRLQRFSVDIGSGHFIFSVGLQFPSEWKFSYRDDSIARFDAKKLSSVAFELFAKNSGIRENNLRRVCPVVLSSYCHHKSTCCIYWYSFGLHQPRRADQTGEIKNKFSWTLESIVPCLVQMRNAPLHVAILIAVFTYSDVLCFSLSFVWYELARNKNKRFQ